MTSMDKRHGCWRGGGGGMNPGEHAEWTMAALILGGLAYCVWHVTTWGYLPAPFFYEPSDVFADWFNPAIWARNPGTYDAWLSIYPPLSFVLLKLFGIDSCYAIRGEWDAGSGLAARDCDWVGLACIFGLYLLNVWLCWKSFAKMEPRTALPRTICVGLGMPMLCGLERGNLILLAFPAMVLAFGPVLRNVRLKALAAGFAVNLKVYLIGSIFGLLLVRRWARAEAALLAAVVVYLVSYAMLGRGSPVEIVENVRSFGKLQPANILDVWYSTTYQTFVALLEGDNFPLVGILGSRVVEGLAMLLPALQQFTQLLIVLAAAATWLRPEAVPPFRAVNLGMTMALISSEPGAYAQVLLLYFVMLEARRGVGRSWAIFMCYLLAVPLDIPLDRMAEVPRDSYFTGSTVMVTYQVVLGSFVRPLMIMTVAWGLSGETIRAVLADIRAGGWAQPRRFVRLPYRHRARRS